MQQRRRRREIRTRARVTGTARRPRLSIFRSLRYTNAQVIDDTVGMTLWSGSTKGMSGDLGKTDAAFKLGRLAAQGVLEKKISTVVFDRGPYRYHGRVRAVAEGARQGGLEF